MKKIQLILLTAITLLMTACGTTQTVPLTGRKHRIGVSDEQLLSLSQQQYSTYMQKAKKSTNAANTQMVVRVGAISPMPSRPTSETTASPVR